LELLKMKFATFPASAGRFDESLKTGDPAGDAWWVRFGSDHFVYAANNKWDGVSARLGAHGEEQPVGSVRKGNMHLVVQKGRTFQQAFPDIPVLLDKGRYLVVDMAQSAARKARKSDEVCFHIEPLKENHVVFEDRARKVTRAAPEGASDIVASLSADTFIARLQKLVSYPTRLSSSSHFSEAADWCETELSTMGYATRQETVSLPGSGQSSNVIATRSGVATGDRKNLIVVAHLDSVNHPGGALAPAPGADDNASGSAGLLSLAEAMAMHKFNHDLTFLLVGGEEQGLHGSTQFLRTLSAEERERTIGVLNMDMIGSVNATPQTVLLEGADLSEDQIDALASSASEFTSLAVQTSLNPFASDHVPFIDAGIPAVLTIEGSDSANDAIHTADDTLNRVTPAFALEILKMNAGYLAMAAGLEKPKSDCGCGDGDGDPLADLKHEIDLHYHTLMAQYVRLGREGALDQNDLADWYRLKAGHDLLMADGEH